jgi:hypothetical protein
MDGIIGWVGSVYFDDKSVDFIKCRYYHIRGRSLEFVQRECEKSAIKYLFGHGFLVLKTLKKVGLLEEMLSEVGIDI